MAVTVVDGNDLKEMFAGGLANLKLNVKTIDDLNVFPIPDGDTGSNMQMTLEGAVRSVINDECKDLSVFAPKFSKGALLGARGNSGVILSQFIKGFSVKCAEMDQLGMQEFADCMKAGVDRAYESVIKPTEGTILTVMREGWEFIASKINELKDFSEFFAALNRRMDESLENTPNLLPVLKEAGVIDSGGAGFICIFKGMEKTINGEPIDKEELFSAGTGAGHVVDASVFNADSELVYGYCTEFILQLQNKKVNPATFDINEIISYLETIGNSIVAVKDDDLVKVHVHTFTPGKVLDFGQKFGEFITLKIENMSVQHNESSLFKAQEEKPKVHKPIAVVAVANGPGLKTYFQDLGVDVCIDGGQCENPCAEDFIAAFESLDADDIIVLPCNSNIVMAAGQAAEMYSDANVHVLKAKSIAEGYAAISLMDLTCSIDEVIESMQESIDNTTTGLITTSVRDVEYSHISVKKGHYIGMDREKVISDSVDKLDAVKGLLNGIDGIKDKEVVTIFYGADVTEEEKEKLNEILDTEFPWLEYGAIDGDQKIYDFIFSIE